MPYGTMELDADGRVPTHPGKACGPCTACCSSVPVQEIGLPAYQRCPHLMGPPSAHIGCGVYETRPDSCYRWSCMYLASDLPEEFRPDRCGFVVDPIPDMVRVAGIEKPAGQIWVLPGHEEAYNGERGRHVIEGFCSQGLAVMWRLPPGPDGKARGRVFVAVDGGIAKSDIVIMESNLPGFADERSRLRRAQELTRDLDGQ